jgi:hypothetical protein
VTGYNSSSITIHFTPDAENSSFPYLLKSQVESKAISLGGMDWSVYGVGKGFSNVLNMDYKNSHILLTILSTVLGLVPFVWGGQNEVFWFAFAAGAWEG